MLEVLNLLCTREEYRQAVATLDGEKFFEKSENTP